MRKILVVICLVSLFGNAKGQTNVYHAFPDSNAVWNVSSSNGQYSPLIGYDNYSYIMKNDTTIGAHTYRRIQYIDVSTGYDFSIHQSYYYGIINNYFYRAIRQDTAAKKVYLYNPGGDTLLYDFNLNIGDTIKTYVGYSGGIYPAYVTSIDSVLMGTHYNKRFNLGGQGVGGCSLIEGVGSTHGLFEPLSIFEINWGLICFSRDGQTLFPTNSTGNCWIESINELSINNEISLSPNPTTTSFTITTTGNKIKEIKVVDVLGEMVFQSEPLNNQSTINSSQFSKGIYFVEITDEKGIVANRKVVIN